MLKILSWNICCLPKKYNFYHNPKPRIDSIIKKIFKQDAQIVLLQEAFEKEIHLKILDKLVENNYDVHTTNKFTYSSNISGNGLITAVNKELGPILKMTDYKFKNKSKIDNLVDKGILKTEINGLDIYNTHIQSDYTPICKYTRYKQYEEIMPYINTENELIFGGDFNEDYNNKELNMLIEILELQKNPEKLITFPYYNIQLDYILHNCKKLNIYKMKKSLLSDHNMIICNIK